MDTKQVIMLKGQLLEFRYVYPLWCCGEVVEPLESGGLVEENQVMEAGLEGDMRNLAIPPFPSHHEVTYRLDHMPLL